MKSLFVGNMSFQTSESELRELFAPFGQVTRVHMAMDRETGRAELLQTAFSKFERNIRDQLGRMLGGAGFDPAKDIEGITVNRWAHGYAFAPNPLFDPGWKEEEKPWVIGRKPFGKIVIANSDAGASAYTDIAIDQAWRAVGELLRS